MILVNLNEEKTIKFNASDVSKLKGVTLVIQKLPNNLELKYTGIIKDSIIEFKIPILKDIIKNEIICSCHLELEYPQGAFLNIAYNQIHFQFFKVIEFAFHQNHVTPPKIDIVKNEESIIQKREIEAKYQTKDKPRRRCKILTMNELV